MEAGPAFFPGPMELVIIFAGFLCSVVLPIAALVGIFLYLQKIDRRIERIERWLAQQRPARDPGQQDPNRPLE